MGVKMVDYKHASLGPLPVGPPGGLLQRTDSLNGKGVKEETNNGGLRTCLPAGPPGGLLWRSDSCGQGCASIFMPIPNTR